MRLKINAFVDSIQFRWKQKGKLILIQRFNDNEIHINDVDFTRDYAGVIQKDEVIDSLV